ncbi:urease accessory protein UreF [Paenibacillus xylaniclasticus]|uniref:urease accessory protein UreF n=1 Tax=Paenibacillus xylaniclasticus TaxID=588083 RepID=UPI001FEBAD90|nr:MULTISPECIES: urease accessory protein UreF [Paenibacillus]
MRNWLTLQQLLDSAIPIGGFSHSFGLETMVQEGRMASSSQLETYVRTMLTHSWATSDAMVIKAVYRDAPLEEWDRLWSVERLVHMQRLAIETRQGVEKMGKRLLKLSTDIWPELNMADVTASVKEGHCLATLPLVHGIICLQLGVSLQQACESYFYTSIVTTINSALRLMSIGQTEGQRLIARLTPVTEQAWSIAAKLEPEEAYANMPMAEIAMLRHETLYSRLFMS